MFLECKVNRTLSFATPFLFILQRMIATSSTSLYDVDCFEKQSIPLAKRLLFYLLLIRRQDPSVLDEVLPLTLAQLTLSFATLPHRVTSTRLTTLSSD